MKELNKGSIRYRVAGVIFRNLFLMIIAVFIIPPLAASSIISGLLLMLPMIEHANDYHPVILLVSGIILYIFYKDLMIIYKYHEDRLTTLNLLKHRKEKRKVKYRGKNGSN